MTKTTMAAFLLAGAALLPGTPRAADTWTDAMEALGDYNYPKAMPLIRQSAADGNVRAQEMLGLMLIHGEALVASAIQPDRVEALQWLTKAAAQGSEVAQHLLRSWARRGHADAVQAMAGAGLRP
jgi:TPR repeat protein